jgi:hypothetical protein
MTARGIYFIANDATRELAIAFLNSVRTFEPLMPVCVIPYNDDCEQVLTLQSTYDFAVWKDYAALRWCDGISERFHGTTLGQYRKLAMWDGPFEQFVYIDADSVLLSGLDVIFGLLKDHDIVAASSDIPANRMFVWKDSLPAEPGFDSAYAASTGVLVSKQGLFTPAEIERCVETALPFAEHMELLCAEQAFLNYIFVTSGKRYSSILQAAREKNRRDIPQHVWSGRFQGDLLNTPDPVLIIHWAGEWRSGEHRRSPVWNYFRHLRDEHR